MEANKNWHSPNINMVRHIVSFLERKHNFLLQLCKNENHALEEQLPSKLYTLIMLRLHHLLCSTAPQGDHVKALIYNFHLHIKICLLKKVSWNGSLTSCISMHLWQSNPILHTRQQAPLGCSKDPLKDKLLHSLQRFPEERAEVLPAWD